MCDGRQMHLPLFAHAPVEDAGAETALVDATHERLLRGEALVVKPRHGANSRHVFMWTEPMADRSVIAEGVRAALTGHDESWARECWQLSQVPKGALLQPLYAITVPLRPDAGPKVVGGTLNTHPQLLWVTRAGCVQLWDLPDLQERGHNRCRQLERLYGRALPQEVLCLLRQVLRRDWQMIRGTSEKVTRSAGLDELRVDWLLGDEFWGSRIGELTYMGAGSRVTPPLSRRLARAYAAGHLVRLGRVSIELDAEGHNNSDALWPTDELRPDRTRRYQTLYCIHITVVVIEYSHTLTIV
ncbi:unnamed protein product [Prorocentrum cordatum]|uniref:Uncharacterized protein n=1 Tax=Prorocentrum cordatum TaxID=2364126 RepID=A0ABN9SY31_9DINO|nr:unnamed protein product [Polarella glacialis]